MEKKPRILQIKKKKRVCSTDGFISYSTSVFLLVDKNPHGSDFSLTHLIEQSCEFVLIG